LHNVPSPFSFCGIALAGVHTKHLVAGGIPELTTSVFAVVAIDDAELPKTAPREHVKWGTFLAGHHASEVIRSGCDAIALLNDVTRTATQLRFCEDWLRSQNIEVLAASALAAGCAPRMAALLSD